MSYKNDLTYQVATGTATALVISTATLTNGYAKTFIAKENNNGAATKINGKPLFKPSTPSSPTLITGKAYKVWYNSTNDCFFIKASADGNATADKVLAGNTFSNEIDTGLPGTMPNRGTFNLGLGATVPAGFYSGGTAPSGIRYAKGTEMTFSVEVANGQSTLFATIPKSDIPFTPKTIIVNFSYNSCLLTANLRSTVMNHYSWNGVSTGSALTVEGSTTNNVDVSSVIKVPIFKHINSTLSVGNAMKYY